MTSGAGASSPRESPLRRKARSFLDRDAWSAGRRYFEGVVRRAPRNAEARAHLGFFCVKESRYDTARGLREFERAVRLDPRCALAHLYRGITLGYMLELASARKAVARAGTCGASPADLSWAKGAIELDGGSVRKAIAHFQRWSRLAGGSTSLILLSQAYSQAGLNRKALTTTDRAALLNPEDFRAPLYGGIYLAYLGRFAQARRRLMRALSMTRKSPLLHHALAHVARKQGNGPAEERHLRAALRVDPLYVTSRKALADLCAGAGRSGEARKHYLLALKSFPDYREAREGLRRLSPPGGGA